jgi:hypothetical protein
MITKEKAVENIKIYLIDKKRQYLKLNEEKIRLEENEEIGYGKYEDKKRSIYIMSYEVESYQNTILHFITVDAETGEVLFTMSPHGYVEDWED